MALKTSNESLNSEDLIIKFIIGLVNQIDQRNIIKTEIYWLYTNGI